MANAKKSSTTTTTATPTKASTLPPGTVITNGRTGLPGVIDVNKAKGIKRPITFGEILSDSEEGDEAKEGQGDSEDEVEQVFAGLQTASQFCRPVATTTYGGAMLLRAIKYGRYREQLFSSNPGR